MFCILFGLWIIFNGRWTAEIALTGAAVSALIYAFTCKYIGLSPRQELRWVRRAGKALGYLGYLLGQIFRAGFRVLGMVWRFRREPEPELRSFRTGIRTEFGKAILGDSITLTPGTVTVRVQGDRLLVHCLDGSMAEGLENSEFERRIRRMEAGEDGG